MKLGDTVKHKITGFEGVITGTADYITGCRQHLVTSKTLKSDGDTLSLWLDEVMLTQLDMPSFYVGVPATQAGGPSLGPNTVVQAPRRR